MTSDKDQANESSLNKSSKNFMKDSEELTDAEARNALVTANGIALAFEVTFATDWLNGDEDWELIDLWFGVPSFISIVLLIVALWTGLLPYKQKVKRYEMSSGLFIAGMIAALIAILLSPFTSNSTAQSDNVLECNGQMKSSDGEFNIVCRR